MKYFYTDPLSAAWMAKHFGMTFETEPELVKVSFEGMSYKTMDFLIVSGYALDSSREVYYIHPDSLPILEPKIKDLVEVNIHPEPTHLMVTSNFFEWGMYSAVSKVIQRSGVAFMWPEIEE